MNGSVYERELLHILAGDERYLKTYNRKLKGWDSELRGLMEKPFFVTRSAGSLKADLIAIRHDVSLVIEVKSSAKPNIVFSEASGQRQDQAERLTKSCEKAGLFITYAYRLKNSDGDPWRMFAMPGTPLGTAKVLHRVLPQASITREGYYGLKWDNGLALSEFIRWINKLS